MFEILISGVPQLWHISKRTIPKINIGPDPFQYIRDLFGFVVNQI